MGCLSEGGGALEKPGAAAESCGRARSLAYRVTSSPQCPLVPFMVWFSPQPSPLSSTLRMFKTLLSLSLGWKRSSARGGLVVVCVVSCCSLSAWHLQGIGKYFFWKNAGTWGFCQLLPSCGLLPRALGCPYSFFFPLTPFPGDGLGFILQLLGLL